MASSGSSGGATVEVVEDSLIEKQYQVARIPQEWELPSLEYKLKTIDHVEETFELATAIYKDPSTQLNREVRVKRCKFGPLTPWVPVANKNDIKLKDKIRFIPKKSAKEVAGDKTAAREQEVQNQLNAVLKGGGQSESRWRVLDSVKERDLDDYYRSDLVEVYLRDQRLDFCNRIFDEVDFWSHVRFPFKLPRLFDVIVPIDKGMKNDRLDVMEAYLVYDMPRRLEYVELFHFLFHMHRQNAFFAKSFGSSVSSVYLDPAKLVPTYNLEENAELKKREKARLMKQRTDSMGMGGGAGGPRGTTTTTPNAKGRVPGLDKKKPSGLTNSSGMLTQTPALGDEGIAVGSGVAAGLGVVSSAGGPPGSSWSEYQLHRYSREDTGLGRSGSTSAASLKAMNERLRVKKPVSSVMHFDDRFIAPEQAVGASLSDKTDVFAAALAVATDKLNTTVGKNQGIDLPEEEQGGQAAGPRKQGMKQSGDESLRRQLAAQKRQLAEVPVCAGIEPPVERLVIGCGVKMFFDEEEREKQERRLARGKRAAGVFKTSTSDVVGPSEAELVPPGPPNEVRAGAVGGGGSGDDGKAEVVVGVEGKSGDVEASAEEVVESPTVGGEEAEASGTTLEGVTDPAERARLEQLQKKDDQYGVITPLVNEVKLRSNSPVMTEKKAPASPGGPVSRKKKGNKIKKEAGAKNATSVEQGTKNEGTAASTAPGAQATTGGAEAAPAPPSTSTTPAPPRSHYSVEQRQMLGKMREFFWKYNEPLEWEDVQRGDTFRALSDSRLEGCFDLEPSKRPSAWDMIQRLDKKYDPDVEEKVRCENRGIDFQPPPTDLLLQLAQRREEEWDYENFSEAVLFRFHFLRLAQRFHADYYVPPLPEFDKQWRKQFE